LDELKALAEKATPGDWFEVDGERILVDLRHLPKGANGLLAEVFDPVDGDTKPQTGVTRANAAFISAANPETVLALIARVEALSYALEQISQGLLSPLSGASWGKCDR
jgi:hypothetical protein